MGALVPVRAQHHPFAGIDCAMFGLPSLYMVDGQQEVGVFGAIGGEIQHVDRGDKALHGQGIGVAIGIVAAGDPVMRGVEMRAGMFTDLQPVPRPERAILIIFADAVYFDRRGVLGKIGRQFQQRGLRAEDSGAIDHLDPASGEHGGQIGQQICRCHCRLPDVYPVLGVWGRLGRLRGICN